MVEVTLPTSVPASPRNYRELFLAPGAPAIPAALQTLQPGQIFQLAQPRWPIDSTPPSFYALVITVIFGTIFLVLFKDVAALINYEIRSRFNVRGNPMVGVTISLLAVTMILITYENDIRKRTGYYAETSDPRYIVAATALMSVLAIIWASNAFSTDVTPKETKSYATKANSSSQNDTPSQPRISRRQLNKRAKRDAKKQAQQAQQAQQ